MAVNELLNRRRSQAATAHSFGLPEILALQSVTSVPARSLEAHHRIGYTKPGYDADLVVWNSHPLSAGASPLQVYIDGRPTLEEKAEYSKPTRIQKPSMRAEAAPEDVQAFCSDSTQDATVLITGISTSYLENAHVKQSSGENLTMVLKNGEIDCLGEHDECVSTRLFDKVISLRNGHVLPGLTTVSSGLGIIEIESEKSTSDGVGDSNANIYDPESAVYAKYGIHFEGKAFDRARIGGVTRSITYPYSNGFLRGVSTGFKIAEGSNPLNGIFKDDAALHFVVGQEAKGMLYFNDLSEQD
jgi:imidazolonepropionase-like amidohydrolase